MIFTAAERKGVLRVALFITLLFCGQVTATGEQSVIRVPGTRVSVDVPNGFELAQEFPGFQRADMASSIVVTEMPAPFETIRSDMTEAGLASQGMRLKLSKKAQLANLDGLLILASQEAYGISFNKWIGVFGTNETTVMVVATFPEVLEAELSELLQHAVRSVEWHAGTDIDVFDGLGFRIKETSTLRIATRMLNTLVLTKSGEPGPVAPDEPLLIVGPLVGQGEIEDVVLFAENRIMTTATVEGIRVIGGESISIGSTSGYEIEAVAKHSESGVPVVLYQVILMTEGTYYIVQGFVGAALADTYIPQFVEVVKSLSVVD